MLYLYNIIILFMNNIFSDSKRKAPCEVQLEDQISYTRKKIFGMQSMSKCLQTKGTYILSKNYNNNNK